ncbi:MAG: ABC transporter ATP-binding protein [Candidatus Micrarchaeaceae archaeon]
MSIKRNAEASRFVVKLDNVWKEYRSKEISYTAIKGISLTISRGEFLTILGASGSGKTTLLDLIGTLDNPTKGKIFIDGVDTSLLSDKELSLLRNEKIGFVFQAYNLVPYLTALENAILPLVVCGRDNEQGIEFAKKLLSEVGLREKINKKPNEVSGGEQQRIAIVRALINKPQLVLADEPTGNLDSKNSEAVLHLLAKMSKEENVTVVMATHDPDLTKLSDRSIYIKDGLIEKETRVRQ